MDDQPSEAATLTSRVAGRYMKVSEGDSRLPSAAAATGRC